MAVLGSAIVQEVGLKLIPCTLGSNVVLRTAGCTLGVALPVYSTFKAIEKKDPNEQEKWLLYWAAYGSFSLVETFSDKLISWIPYYYHLKLVFVIWLQFPSNDGSRQSYSRCLRPFLLRHQASLDRFLSFASREIVKLHSGHLEEINYLKSLLGKFAIAAFQMVKGVFRLEGPEHPPRHSSIEGPSSTLALQAPDPDSDSDN